MNAHGHSHGHAHGHDSAGAQRTALIISIGANSALFVAQVVVGLSIGSLALLADSLHNGSDVVALAIALLGQGLATRPATPQRSFGLARAEILAAAVNGAALMALTVWVLIEAVSRLSDPHVPDPGPLALIGLLGLLVNGASAWFLHRSGGDGMNLRAAMWHLVADALGSLGVIVAAAAQYAFGITWADPVASILISVLVLAGVWRLMNEAVAVLLEATPAGIDPDEVERALTEVAGVRSAHHLHIWAIDSNTSALTCHLLIEDGSDLHAAQLIANTCRVMLVERFDIDHATFEPECHDCGAPGH